MKKVYFLFVLMSMSIGIFAQTKRINNQAISSKEIVHVLNQPSSTKAIIDSLHYDGNPFKGIGTNDTAILNAFAFFPSSILSAHNSVGNTISQVKV